MLGLFFAPEEVFVKLFSQYNDLLLFFLEDTADNIEKRAIKESL
jgi:hypothetical protein